jgi:deoxyribose-phosphate aldolase
MVKGCKKALGNSGYAVAFRGHCFSKWQAPRDVKIRDTKYAVNEGADEVDMVISRGKIHARGKQLFVV